MNDIKQDSGQPARQVDGDERERRVLLLTSYCGGDAAGCTNETPCTDCLRMCNVALTSGDMKVVGQFDQQPTYTALAPVAVVMPERMEIPGPIWADARYPVGAPLNAWAVREAESWNEALDEVARLNAAPVTAAELAALRRDANYWRFLRDNGDAGDHDLVLARMYRAGELSELRCEVADYEGAIDDAIAQQQEGEKP